jgi:preprotein translocase subunit YajC
VPSFLFVIVLLFVVMYVMMIRPQRQRQREQQAMIEGAAVGDDILTTGGIYGTVTRAEGDDVVVEIAEGLEVHMTRRGIAAVLPPEQDDAEDDGEDDEDVIDVEPSDDHESGDGEAPVTVDEEAVTSDAGADTTALDRR